MRGVDFDRSAAHRWGERWAPIRIRAPAISPDGTGYGFLGLERNTAVAIDPSGNVWLMNNWIDVPNLQTNPGGHEIVAFVGLAGPVQPPAPIP